MIIYEFISLRSLRSLRSTSFVSRPESSDSSLCSSGSYTLTGAESLCALRGFFSSVRTRSLPRRSRWSFPRTRYTRAARSVIVLVRTTSLVTLALFRFVNYVHSLLVTRFASISINRRTHPSLWSYDLQSVFGFVHTHPSNAVRSRPTVSLDLASLAPGRKMVKPLPPSSSSPGCKPIQPGLRSVRRSTARLPHSALTPFVWHEESSCSSGLDSGHKPLGFA